MAEKTTPPAPKRMSLANGRKGLRGGPEFVVVHGVEKIGKSTFGNDAPASAIIPVERGISRIEVKTFAFAEPETWQDILDALDELRQAPHDFKTVVIDTLDAAVPLLKSHVSKREGWDAGGLQFEQYGRGFSVWLFDWVDLIKRLNQLRDERGMSVIVTAHSSIRKFRNPTGDDFDRWAMNALGDKTPDLFYRQADAILFAHWEDFVSQDKETKKVRTASSGIRLAQTVRTAAWDAGNRYGLPPVLPFDYASYAKARDAATSTSAEEILAEIMDILPRKADEAERKKIEKYTSDKSSDRAALSVVLNNLRSRADR